MGSKTRRIWELILEHDEGLKAKDLVALLAEEGIKIHVNSIYSQIATINETFAPYVKGDLIKTVRGKGFYVEQSYFDDGEIQFLADTITFHQELSTKEKETLLRKLMVIVDEGQKKRLHLTPIEKKDENHYFMVNLSVVLKAIANKTNLSFEYVDYDIFDGHPIEVASLHGSHEAQYIVSPYALILNHNHYYMLGEFTKRKGQLSIYRIDRMRKVMTTRRNHHDFLSEYQLEDYLQQHFPLFYEGNFIDMTISFKQFLLREIVSQFGEQMTLVKENDEMYRAIIKNVRYTQGLKMWLLQYGANLYVHSPKVLREDLKAELEKALSAYR